MRAHYYVSKPALAETDLGFTTSLAKRAMQAVVRHGTGTGNDEAVALFREFYEYGPGKVEHPGIRDMIKALVTNLKAPEKDRNKYIDHLDAEYSLSTGYAHGSQAVLLDVLDGSGPSAMVHRRTRALERGDEVLRSICCMLALIAAVEIFLERGLGARNIYAELNKAGPFGGGQTTIARHNVLRALLGIA
jgi:hypothetical protein